MVHDTDAFESAYRRLAATRLSETLSPYEPPRGPPHDRAPHEPAAVPRSRLLPRLALMAPRRRPTPFER